MQLHCWIGSEVLVGKVGGEGFVMGDVDLQVELTLNEKEILSYLYGYRIMFIDRDEGIEEHMAESLCFSP